MHAVDVILYIGTFTFALTGALKARAYQMDIFGASVLAFATAYEGGTLRDILIGIRVGWMNDNIPLTLVASAVIVVFLVKQNIKALEKAFFLTDAIGLAMFTAGGIQRSLDHGITQRYSVILGIMSATFGGLIADLLTGKTPALLQKAELYATASAIGGIVYLALKYFSFSADICLFVCVIIVVSVRIISKKRNLACLRFKYFQKYDLFENLGNATYMIK